MKNLLVKGSPSGVMPSLAFASRSFPRDEERVTVYPYAARCLFPDSSAN
jgi:hypothetical protein